MASTNSPTPTQIAIRAPALRTDGRKTTSTTPRIAADASACPDGNDSLVSVTNRKSAGRSFPADGGLAEPHQQPRPGGDHRHQRRRHPGGA